MAWTKQQYINRIEELESELEELTEAASNCQELVDTLSEENSRLEKQLEPNPNCMECSQDEGALPNGFVDIPSMEDCTKVMSDAEALIAKLRDQVRQRAKLAGYFANKCDELHAYISNSLASSKPPGTGWVKPDGTETPEPWTDVLIDGSSFSDPITAYCDDNGQWYESLSDTEIEGVQWYHELPARAKPKEGPNHFSPLGVI